VLTGKNSPELENKWKFNPYKGINFGPQTPKLFGKKFKVRLRN